MISSSTDLVPSSDRCLRWAQSRVGGGNLDRMENDTMSCLHHLWRHQIQPANPPFVLATQKSHKYPQQEVHTTISRAPTIVPRYAWWRSAVRVESNESENGPQVMVSEPASATDEEVTTVTTSPYPWRQPTQRTLQDSSRLGGYVLPTASNGVRGVVYPSESSPSGQEEEAVAVRVPWLLRFSTHEVTSMPSAPRATFLTFHWFPEISSSSSKFFNAFRPLFAQFRCFVQPDEQKWRDLPSVSTRGAEVLFSAFHPRFAHRVAVTEESSHVDPRYRSWSILLEDVYQSGPQRWRLDDHSPGSQLQRRGYTFPMILTDWSCRASVLAPLGRPNKPLQNGVRPPSSVASPGREHSPDLTIGNIQHEGNEFDASSPTTTTFRPPSSWWNPLAARLSFRGLIEAPFLHGDTLKALFRLRLLGAIGNDAVQGEVFDAEFAQSVPTRKEWNALTPMLSSSVSPILRGVSWNPSAGRTAAAVPWLAGCSFEAQLPRPGWLQTTFFWSCLFWGSPVREMSAEDPQKKLVIAGVSLSRSKSEVGGIAERSQTRVSRWGVVVPQRLDCGLQWFRVDRNKKHEWSTGVQQGGSASEAVELLSGLFHFRHLKCSVVWDWEED